MRPFISLITLFCLMNIRDEVEILKFMLALSDFSKTRAFMQISCVAFAPDIEIDPSCSVM